MKGHQWFLAHGEGMRPVGGLAALGVAALWVGGFGIPFVGGFGGLLGVGGGGGAGLFLWGLAAVAFGFMGAGVFAWHGVVLVGGGGGWRGGRRDKSRCFVRGRRDESRRFVKKRMVHGSVT